MKPRWLAILLLGLALPALAAEEELYFFNWSEYLPEEVLDEFTRETGIKVVYSTYDSNEAMYAKVKLAGGGYDLVVPSTYYVSKMRREGMLEPLDKAKIPNLKNLNPELLDKPYDPGNAYSVPYLWGSTGIGVNAARVDPATVTAWADLWDPRFRGKLLLTNDVREVFHMALRVLGYSGNSADPKEIEAAYRKLQELMPNVRVFNSDNPKVPYLTGEVVAGMLWNGEAYAAKQENPDIRYVYPREGAILWVDSLVIPKGARHRDAAHRMIDFLLRPEVAKRICEEVGYATPNREAWKLLAPEVRDDRTVYPAPEDLRNAEVQVDVGEAITVYERFWEQLKAGR
ncbi:extracellular solute-binding protein [Deferrisoma sp.]